MIVNKYGGNGGGGGSYVLPAATSSSLGGVKIGEGISVQNDGTISVSGGSSQQNYVVVNSLNEITAPFEGLKVYVRSGSTSEVWQGWALSASTITQDYVAHAVKGSTDVRIYKSGNSFFWDWENDGQLHSKGDYAYIADPTNGVFSIFFPDKENWTLQNITEGVETGETSTNLSVSWDSVQYLYNGTEYIQDTKPVYILNDMEQADRVKLYKSITAVTYDDAHFNSVIEENDFYYRYNEGPNGDRVYVKLDSIAFNAGKFIFRAMSTNFNSNMNGAIERLFHIVLRSDGSLTVANDKYSLVLDVRVNSSSAITFDDGVYDGYFERMAGGNCPVSLKVEIDGFKCISTNTVVVENSNGGTPFLYADLVDASGKTWEAKWQLQKNSTPIYFREKSAGGREIVDLDALSQSEKADLFAAISALTSQSEAVNDKYVFIKDFTSVHGGNQSPIIVEYSRYERSKMWFLGINFGGHTGEFWRLTYTLMDDGTDEVGMDVNYTFPGLQKLQIISNRDYLKYDFTTSTFSTNNAGDTMFTGDTCSGAWVFNTDRNQNAFNDAYAPEYILRITDTDVEDRKLMNPVVYYDTLSTPVTLTDASGTQRPFGYIFYFDYGKYTVSMYADWDQQRYARLSIAKNY